MPMLGDMLAAARDSAASFHAWLDRSDPSLAEQVRSAAGEEGCSPTSYIRAAMSDFQRFAAEEDWATLISSLRDSEDPGTVFLLGMVHWRLTAPACKAHAEHRTASAEATQ